MGRLEVEESLYTQLKMETCPIEIPDSKVRGRRMANIWKNTENVLDANVTAYILKYLKYPGTFLLTLCTRVGGCSAV